MNDGYGRLCSKRWRSSCSDWAHMSLASSTIRPVGTDDLSIVVKCRRIGKCLGWE